MAHIAADRIRETTTTTGTGALTLAGAATGFRAFSAVCAVSDTVPYCIAHQTLDEWEVGIATYSAANTLTRTTVIASSNAGAAVNFSAGTKDVFLTAPAQSSGMGTLLVTPSANQNDYNPTGFGFASRLDVNASASIKLTGLAGGYDGRRVVIHNRAANYLLWLEHENTNSSAANRFDLPNGFPAFLMPEDWIELTYDAGEGRWNVSSWPMRGAAMGLTEFSDFAGSVTGPFTATVNGTGASAQASGYLVNTTERPLGVTQLDTGTVATGRATLGHSSTDAIVPTLGPALSVARLAAEAANSGTETWQLISGFADCAGGTFSDGAAWNLRWNGSAPEWSQDRLSNGSATRSTTGSPTPGTNYIWLVVFVSPAWDRVDFIYSEDSVSFTLADSPATGLPGSGRNTAWVAASIIKSAGTTQRNVSVDLAGYRADYVRA